MPGGGGGINTVGSSLIVIELDNADICIPTLCDLHCY